MTSSILDESTELRLRHIPLDFIFVSTQASWPVIDHICGMNVQRKVPQINVTHKNNWKSKTTCYQTIY